MRNAKTISTIAFAIALSLIAVLIAEMVPSESQGQVIPPLAPPSGAVPTNFVLKDDFPNNSVSSSTIGELNWILRNVVGTCPAAGFNVGALPNLGIIQLNSTSSSVGCNMVLDSSTNAMLGNLVAYQWDSSWVASISSITGIEARLGFVAANQSTAVPTSGHYWRFDTQLKDIASGTCNDAANKCGLTTLSCSSTQTVTFTIPGGTGTGSVACTGTNAIANTTAITVVAAGAGYNATGAPTTGVPTGGSATYTGTLAITYTLGSAGTGPDVDWNVCEGTGSSVEVCKDVGVAPVASTFYRFRTQNVGNSTLQYTLYTAGAQSISAITSCASGCSLVATPSTVADSPSIIEISGSAGAIDVVVDYWNFISTGLAR